MAKIPTDMYGEFGDAKAREELLEIEYRLAKKYLGTYRSEEDEMEEYMKNFWKGT